MLELREVETYVDGTEASTVTGSHVLVESLDGLGAGHLTELLVHVVGTGAGVVAEPDTEVLDLEGALLGDLDETRVSNGCEREGSRLAVFLHVRCSG